MAADILEARGDDPVRTIRPEETVLPSEIAVGMERLTSRRPPRLTRPEIWAEVVADAQRLVTEGWAAQAVALGWSATDLFGIGPHDDWEFEGLAVWLRRRKLALIDADVAVAHGAASTAHFMRGGAGHGTMPTIQPVPLWDFGGRT